MTTPDPAPSLGEPHRVALAPALTTPTCDVLHEQLVAALAADAPVEIDASAVETVGQAALQLLAAAHREVAGRGGSFVIAAPSASFTEQVTRCGMAALVGLETGDSIQ